MYDAFCVLMESKDLDAEAKLQVSDADRGYGFQIMPQIYLNKIPYLFKLAWLIKYVDEKQIQLWIRRVILIIQKDAQAGLRFRVNPNYVVMFEVVT